MNRLSRLVSSPVRGYVNPRFDALRGDLAGLHDDLAALREQLGRVEQVVNDPPAPVLGPEAFLVDQRARQADWLEKVDVSFHNATGGPVGFGAPGWYACSAAQCEDPVYLEWFRLLEEIDPSEPVNLGRGRQYNRKVWEWAYILENVRRAGLLEPGRRALGFGVGTEPVPAAFARHGVEVLATDQGRDAGASWDQTNELNRGVPSLHRPNICADATVDELVRTREADMNALPTDLGSYDVVWSSCVIEHLGSPQRGLDIVLESVDLLEPGGIAVHTTELELTPQEESRDWGHSVVYRPQELLAFAERVRAAGHHVDCTLHVSMDTPADRWISLAHVDGPRAPFDWAHLKLVIGESVSTSYGLVIRKEA